MTNNISTYLQIGDTEKRWGIYVTNVGYTKLTADKLYMDKITGSAGQPAWKTNKNASDYYLVFVSKGKGEFYSSRQKRLEMREGNCFVIFPGMWYRYKPDALTDWEEYCVGFNGYYIDQLMRHRFFTPNQPCIEIGLDKELLTLLQKIIDTVRLSFMGYSQQIAGLTLQILGYINTHSNGNFLDNSPIEKAINKAKFLLQQSLNASVNMPAIARDLHMGYSAFRKNFKTYTGQSPHQYHLKLRIERAKNLLTTTLLTIEEVAMQTGFEQIHYFSKIFKKKAGLSPNAYRKLNT